MKEKSLIGIRTYSEEWDECIIGFVTEIQDSSFNINEIDEYGIGIGNTTIEIKNVLNLQLNDRYQKRLQYTYDNAKIFKANNGVTIWKEGSSLIPYFSDLIASMSIVTFYFNEDDYVIGMISKFDKEHILIKNVGVEGDEDGESCYLIENLIGMRYNSLEEQRIALLYANRMLFYKKK